MSQVKDYSNYSKERLNSFTILKVVALFLAILFCYSSSYAQSVKRQVICSLGSFHQGPNIMVNTTFGQPPNAGTLNSNANYLRQGFQQPICLRMPQAMITASSDSQCLDGNNFSFQYPLNADSLTTFQWSFGEGSNITASNSKDPSGIKYTSYGTKTVQLTVRRGACKSSAFSDILVTCEPLPNAFTPNNDGINDIYLIGYDLTILNRWGQVLYAGLTGWDGKFKGDKVSPGTYYYIVKQGSQTLKGTVLLIEE